MILFHGRGSLCYSQEQVVGALVCDRELVSRLEVRVLRFPPMRISHIAVVAALVTIFSLAVKPVIDPDFWWHLATGRYMVLHHLIPSHDVFSITAQSHRWITHEWLTELLFIAGWTHGGYRLLMLATALVITAVFLFVYLAARERGAPPLVCGPIILLAALASAHTWGTRPQMLSLLLMGIFTFSLTRMTIRRTAGPSIWLPVLMVLWVNLHGGFIFGLALMGLATAGYTFQEFWNAAASSSLQRSAVSTDVLSETTTRSEPDPDGKPTASAGRGLALVALTGLATLVNPNGIAGALYPLSYLGNNASTRYIAEWVSPDFHKTQYLFFEALVLILLIGGMASGRRMRLADLLVVLPFTYLAFESVRNISLFAVVAAPIAAELVTSLLPEHWRMSRSGPVVQGRSLINMIAAACIAIGIAVPTLGKFSQATQNKAVATAFPVGAVRYIDTHALPQRGFDSYNWGGYLIWNLYPTRHVFVDGRPDMYGDRFMDRYINAYDGAASWRGLFQEQSLCYALVEPSSGIARALDTDTHWVVKYRDVTAVLYVASAKQPGCV